jgi:hypothetical protein
LTVKSGAFSACARLRMFKYNVTESGPG